MSAEMNLSKNIVTKTDNSKRSQNESRGLTMKSRFEWHVSIQYYCLMILSLTTLMSHIVHTNPISSEFESNCSLQSLQSVQHELLRQKLAANRMLPSSANQNARSDPIISSSRPKREAYDLPLHVTKKSAPYYAKAEVSVTLRTAHSPKRFDSVNNRPATSSARSNGVHPWYYSQEKVASVCLLFDEQNAHLAHQATIRLQVNYKDKLLKLQVGADVNTNGGPQGLCRSIVDYCYAIPLLSSHVLKPIYEGLANSQDQESDQSEMIFSVEISNISSQLLETAELSQGSAEVVEGFKLLVETINYDMHVPTDAVNSRDGVWNNYGTSADENNQPTDRETEVIHNSSSIMAPDFRPCGERRYHTCEKDNSLCCTFILRYDLNEILVALLPEEEGVRYKTVTPDDYTTLLCKGSSVQYEDPKRSSESGLEIPRSDSWFIDYLEAVTGITGNSTCVPNQYERGTVVYDGMITLSNGTEIFGFSHQIQLDKYKILNCGCRE